MKITVDTKEFQDCIRYAGLGARGNPLKFTLSPEILTITGGDGECWLSRTMAIWGNEQAQISEFFLDPATLLPVATLNSSTLTLTDKENRIVITWPAGKIACGKLPESKYERPAIRDMGPSLTIELNDMKRAIDMVGPAREGKSGGQQTEMFFMECSEDDCNLMAFATDKKRIHSMVVAEAGQDVRLIMSQKLIRAIEAIPKREDAVITLATNEFFTKISTSNGYECVSAVVRVGWIEGWKKIAASPTECKVAKVPVKQLQKSLERICMSSDGTVKMDVFIKDPDIPILFLKSVSENPPRSIQEEVTYEGEAIDETTVNAQHWLAACKCITSQNIQIKWSDTSRFVYLSPDDANESQFSAVIAGFPK